MEVEVPFKSPTETMEAQEAEISVRMQPIDWVTFTLPAPKEEWKFEEVGPTELIFAENVNYHSSLNQEEVKLHWSQWTLGIRDNFDNAGQSNGAVVGKTKDGKITKQKQLFGVLKSLKGPERVVKLYGEIGDLKVISGATEKTTRHLIMFQESGFSDRQRQLTSREMRIRDSFKVYLPKMHEYRHKTRTKSIWRVKKKTHFLQCTFLSKETTPDFETFLCQQSSRPFLKELVTADVVFETRGKKSGIPRTSILRLEYVNMLDAVADILPGK